MVMRFHRGIAVGHFYSRAESLGELNPTVDEGVPMEVDGVEPINAPPPQLAGSPYTSEGGEELLGIGDISDEEGDSGSEIMELGDETGEESDGFYALEPDSEEEPGIYP